MSERHLVCVAHTASATPRRLGGGEAAVIITMLTLAGALAGVGMPVTEILQLLSGAGLLAAVLVAMVGAGPVRALGRAMRALLAPGPHR